LTIRHIQYTIEAIFQTKGQGGKHLNFKSLWQCTHAFLSLLAFLVVGPVILCNALDVSTYDDFIKPMIDTGKWIVNDPSGLFSQRDGRLHFSSKSGAADLRSTATFGPGFYSVHFGNFESTNISKSGAGQGSFLALGLGPRENCVRILRGRVIRGGYFEANLIVNKELRLWYDPAAESDTDGQLGLYYDGSTITFYYNRGSDPDKGWQTVGPKVPAPWSSTPTLFLSGNPGGSGTTTFTIKRVEHRVSPPPTPPPPEPTLVGPQF
jgi:hypothetical protein